LTDTRDCDWRKRFGPARLSSGEWLPGHTWFKERIAAPAWLKPGSAKVDVGLVEAETSRPRVKLAIENVRDDGWHPMALVEVLT